METLATLHQLLRQNQEKETKYGKPIVSRAIHLPMTLSALCGLGANTTQLTRAYDTVHQANYFDNLSATATETITLTADNWTTYLGQYEHLLMFTQFFRNTVKTMGVKATLKNYVPTLMAGISAHAFHPVLRLGYALDNNNDEEVIFSLAYWAATLPKMPIAKSTLPPITPTAFLTGLRATSTFHSIAFSGSIDDRIAKVAEHVDFQPQLAPIQLSTDEALSKTTHLALMLFLATHDFTILHGVTSAHALRLILEEFDDVQRLEFLTHYWYALGAAYVTVGAPELTTPLPIDETNLPSWETIKQQACQNEEDHVIKFVYTCFKQGQAYPEDALFYREAAVRQLRQSAAFCKQPVFQSVAQAQQTVQPSHLEDTNSESAYTVLSDNTTVDSLPLSSTQTVKSDIKTPPETTSEADVVHSPTP